METSNDQIKETKGTGYKNPKSETPLVLIIVIAVLAVLIIVMGYFLYDFSKDLKKFSASAEILITAAGVAKLIKKDFVKKDAIVIDVAIINTEEGICGDVDFENVKKLIYLKGVRI